MELRAYINEHKKIIIPLALLSIILGVIVGMSANNKYKRQLNISSNPIPTPEENLTATTTPLTSSSTPVAIPTPMLFPYIEITESCGPYYNGNCVNMRSGPGTNYPVVKKLRTGMILKVDKTVEREGQKWYRISFDEAIRYPERVKGEWYVAANVSQLFHDDGDHRLTKDSSPTQKRILVDRSEQKLYAYDGDTLFMEEVVSTGKELSPTPRGTFKVFKMTPSRYMQGPLPGISSDYYDLPGVPWNLYFTEQGAVIHGAYWHDKFGQQWSHGCVNLPPEKAKKLYLWADIGTTVTVRD